MNKKSTFFIALVASITSCWDAYSQEFLSDTMHLEGVTVFGVNEEQYAFQVLQQDIKVDSALSQSMTELLLQSLPLSINQYGTRGQLSSINLRGLGPSRTALLWNNMPINSFANGQTDMNLVSSIGASNISLLQGPGASIYGSGAIGGTLAMNSRPTFNQLPRFSLGHSIGSFGFNQTEAGFTYGTDQFAYSIRAQTTQSDNDFGYENNGEEVTQRNAAYDSRNIAQDFAFVLDNTSSISVGVWFAENDRQIQPSRNDFTSSDRLFDRNFRSHLGYYLDKSNWHSEFNLGYTNDHQVFNENTPLVVDRLFGLAQTEWQKHDKLSILAGANTNLIWVDGGAFEEGITENRTDLFTAITWSPLRWLSLTSNLRQPTVDGDFKAFSPSFLAATDLFKTEKLQVALEGQWSRSYRLATLNDRFWDPGGDPDLEAEISNTLDIALSSALSISSLDMEARVNTFESNVDNWILWRPGGRDTDESGQLISFWFPQNLEQVESRGIEYQVETKYSFSDNIKLSLSYQATHSETINQLGLGDSDRSRGKQLIFTPRITTLARVSLDIYGFSLNVNQSMTGERFTEANNELDPLPAFTIYNANVSKRWQWKQFQLLTLVNVFNFTDEDYESFESRAMPGINYDITLKLNYTFQ